MKSHNLCIFPLKNKHEVILSCYERWDVSGGNLHQISRYNSFTGYAVSLGPEEGAGTTAWMKEEIYFQLETTHQGRIKSENIDLKLDNFNTIFE